jgi:hypothetical protein
MAALEVLEKDWIYSVQFKSRSGCSLGEISGFMYIKLKIGGPECILD